MKPIIRLFLILILVAAMGIPPCAAVGFESDDDKTLSPYFMVKSEDPDADRLPLKSTSAEVNIAGVIADVTVTQVYQNEGNNVIEAIYVFPASTRAAVYGMKMTVGERTIVAEIQKKETARQKYEQAKQEGKSASLLEQQRPNVFQMNVANILPGDTITVELKYTELLVPTEGVYSFVYPTVVGPRYSNTPAAAAPASEKWVKNPYTHEGEAPTYTFDIAVNIAAGLPIRKATCGTHKTSIQYEGKNVALVKLDESEKYGGNRDFVLKYQLSGQGVETGLLLFEGKDENFFLLMMQPPAAVDEGAIVPREYIFIVDVSGSMHGFPLDISKTLMRNLISRLKPDDRFNIMLFAGGSWVMSEEGSVRATQENMEKAIQLIDRQRGGGGTEILPAMKRALALPRTPETSCTIVPITDGYVSVEPEVFDLIRTSLGDANLFALGVGSSVNRHIIEGMARVGMGEPLIILKPEDAEAKAEAFRKYIQSPVLTRIQLDFGEFQAYDVEPPSIPDVMAERPVICFGKWKGRPEGKITVKGLAAGKEYSETFNAAEYAPREANSALRYLWARHRIMVLQDYNLLRGDDDRVEMITELGLKYNLLTNYTSFVAVDTEVRNKDGKSETVKQVLPLPQGVSDNAVSFGAGASGVRYKASAPRTFAPAPLMTQELEEAAPVLADSGVCIQFDEVNVAGAPDLEKAVADEIKKRLAGLNDCCKGKAMKGAFAVTFRIGTDGGVSDAEMKEMRLAPSDKACFIYAIEKWRFSGLNNAAPLTVTLTFTVK